MARVWLAPADAHAEAGGQKVEVILNVQNTGRAVDQYSVEVQGLEREWYTLPPSSASLFPEEISQTVLALHPPRGSASRARTYQYMVRVRSRADPAQTATATGTLVVAAYIIFRMELAPQRATGRKGAYRVNLVNGGNSELDVELTAHDPEKACTFRFDPSRLVMQPGTQVTIPLTVQPQRSHLVGQQQLYQFSVTAHSTVPGQPVDAAGATTLRTATGQLIHKPRFRVWWPVLVHGLLVATAIISAALAWSVVIR